MESLLKLEIYHLTCNINRLIHNTGCPKKYTRGALGKIVTALLGECSKKNKKCHPKNNHIMIC